jgi:tRNA(adenine34) deaminase
LVREKRKTLSNVIISQEFNGQKITGAGGISIVKNKANPLLQIDRKEIITWSMPDHEYWMDRAIELAQEAGRQGEIPVGAVIVSPRGELLAEGQNYKERQQNPTAHAEIVAINRACQVLGNWHLTDCLLYVTLEPCPMCGGAIIQSRIATLVYGTPDPKTGAMGTVINLATSPAALHKVQVVAGIRQAECQEMLQSWFRQLRQRKGGTP